MDHAQIHYRAIGEAVEQTDSVTDTEAFSRMERERLLRRTFEGVISFDEPAKFGTFLREYDTAESFVELVLPDEFTVLYDAEKYGLKTYNLHASKAFVLEAARLEAEAYDTTAGTVLQDWEANIPSEHSGVIGALVNDLVQNGDIETLEDN